MDAMNGLMDTRDRRTSADLVFQHLYDEIVSLRLLPGRKMSEADIASQFGISRQPVRDAFNRLGNLGLLLIRPQKATEVKKFSQDAIVTARFVRAAIEIEVTRRAVTRWNGANSAEFERALAEQDAAVRNQDVTALHALDLDFHRQLCGVAQASFAFDTITENKARVDRLCVLSMMQKDGMRQVVEDHRRIFVHLQNRDPDAAEAAMRRHLSRLDATIDTVRHEYAEYFE